MPDKKNILNIEMNKNKIIFFIILFLAFIAIIFIAITIKSGKTFWVQSKANGIFKVWMINWDDDINTSLIKDFKKEYPEYELQKVEFVNFSNYNDYYYALSLAIIWWDAPDLFVLNNAEENPIYSSQIAWLDNKIIKPSSFRKRYRWVFSDDLIWSQWSGKDKIEFVIGLPFWYESLWIFFNRKYVKDTQLWTIGALNNIVAELKDKKSNIIPIWIGNWSTVIDSVDIITQFLMFDNKILSLSDVTWDKLKEAFSKYFLFWDTEWYNWFNSKFLELVNKWKKSVDLFAKWETYMLMWYPSLIKEIKKASFNKNFLLAAPFPKANSWKWNTLINYDYFVINRNSDNIKLWNLFLWFLSTDNWSKKFLDSYPYQLPALLSLESEKLDQYIDDDYNLILDDFYDPDSTLTTFDKWIKSLYDSNIINILDNQDTYKSEFLKMQSSILCKAKKINTLKNLSESCE